MFRRWFSFLLCLALAVTLLPLNSLAEESDSGQGYGMENQSADEGAAPVAVTKVTVSQEGGTTQIAVGDTLQLAASVTPENASDKALEWFSSDNTLATVNGNGLVTGIAQGEVTITAACGKIQGNYVLTVVEAEVQEDEGEEVGAPASFEALKHSLKTAEQTSLTITVTSPIVIKENISIPERAFLKIDSGATITIPDGITLTNDGKLWIVNGELTIQAGASLKNQGEINVHETGCLRAEEGASYSGGSNITGSGSLTGNADRIIGIDPSEISIWTGISTEEELRTALTSGYGSSVLNLEAPIVLTADMTIPKGYAYLAYESITVPDGVSLTVEGNLVFFDMFTLRIQKGGTLNVSSGGYVDLTYYGDNLIVENDAILSANPGAFHVLWEPTEIDTIPNVPNKLLNLEGFPSTVEEINTLIAGSSKYHHVLINLGGITLAIPQDLTIPKNVTVSIQQAKGNSEISVKSGSTLTVNGTLYIRDSSTLLIEEGARIQNNGKISISPNARLIVNGTLTDGGGILDNQGTMTGAAPANSGSCGTDLNWSFNPESGVLSIDAASETGSAMDSYEAGKSPWYPLRDQISAVEMKKGTSVGSYAFQDCTGITEIVFPESLKKIDNNAFQGCTGLKLLHFTGSAPSLAEKAFTTLKADIVFDFDSGDRTGYAAWTEIYGNHFGGEIFWNNPDTSMFYWQADNAEQLEKVCAAETGTGGLTIISIRESFTISRDICIPDSLELVVGKGATLTVASGATLTMTSCLESAAILGTLVIKSGAAVVSPGSITIDSGTLIAENGSSYDIWSVKIENGGAVSGIDKKDVTATYQVYTEAEARSALSNTQYGEVSVVYFAEKPWLLSSDLVIPENATLQVSYSGAESPYALIVRDGTHLTVDGVLTANFRLESGSTLTVSGKGVIYTHQAESQENVTLNVRPGGIYIGVFFPDQAAKQISGIPYSVIDVARCIADEQTLREMLAQADAFHRASAYVTYGPISLTEDLIIPENAEIAIYRDLYLGILEIPNGRTLTNYGEIRLFGGGTLSVLSGGTFVNSGVLSNNGGVLDVQGNAEGVPERVDLTDSGLEDTPEIWVNGVAIPITQDDSGNSFVEIPEDSSPILLTYTYNGDSDDPHTQYPTGMQAYRLEETESGTAIKRLPELDNLLEYSGCSIRITGTKGIRMITSINKDVRDALTGNGLNDYKLLEYGTVLCRASALADGSPMTLENSDVRSNYAYKKGVSDPVFRYIGDLIQYTNVLVGFTDEDCKEDIAMRPYIILEDETGQTYTIYGGIVYRSIGYIAYQNRNAFAPGTAAYDYVWNIIHYVYGDQYDADYKG